MIFIGVKRSLQVYFWIHTSAKNIFIFFASGMTFYLCPYLLTLFFFLYLFILVEGAPCRLGKKDDVSHCNDEIHSGTGEHRNRKGALNSGCF